MQNIYMYLVDNVIIIYVLKGNNFDNNTINYFDLKLNTVNNYCPKCKEKALAFQITMFVD